MRKALICSIVTGLLVASLAGPAAAGKKKHVHESFTVTALPFVNVSATGTEYRSCFAGVEDVHWSAVDFTAPGNGEIRLYMEGFTGDWDVAIFLEDGTPIYSLNDQLQGMAPATEEVTIPLKKGDAVRLVACNYLGAPEAEVHYEGVFK
jgi:hypothetical protein